MGSTSQSSKKTFNLFCQALGGDLYLGLKKSDKWSPNNIRSLHILNGSVFVEYFVGGVEEFAFVTSEEFVPRSMLYPLVQKRKLSKLETISFADAMGGLALAEAVAGQLQQSGYRRLHKFGVLKVGDEGQLYLEGFDLPGSEEWYLDTALEPEHYPFDSNPELISALEASKQAGLLEEYEEVAEEEQEESAQGTADEKEDTSNNPETEVEEAVPEDINPQGTAEDALREEIVSYYRPMTKSVIQNIIDNYTHIFASGYEVIKPKGMLIPFASESRRGLQEFGGLYFLDGSNKLCRSPRSRDMDAVYKEVIKYTGKLDVLETRSNKEIALAVAKASSVDGLYVPYKLVEYAFGREKVKSDNASSLTHYEPHAEAISWGSYVESELRPSLEKVLFYTLGTVLLQRGIVKEEGDIYDTSTGGAVTKILKDFDKVFSQVYLVSKFEEVGDDIASIKLRVLDPYNRVPRDKNILVDALKASRLVDVSGSDKAQVYQPVTKGEYFVEYQIDIDKNLAQAEPLFAFRALKVLNEQGRKLTYDTAIIGKGIDDSILTNDGAVSFTKNLSHLVMAGSRSGKGVWTLNTVAAAIISRKATAYLDNKPDIGDLLNSLSDNMFVINGPAVAHNPSAGTGYFSTFTDEKLNALLAEDRVPPYIRSTFGVLRWGGSKYATVAYLRGLLLWLGIISARASGVDYSALGGERGVILVVDELNNILSESDTLFGVMREIAASGYAQLYRDEGEEAANKKITKPSEFAYWSHSFTVCLENSIRALEILDNAGFKNGENRRSDIFSIMQNPIEQYKVGDSKGYKVMFPLQRNKNDSKPRNAVVSSKLISSMVVRGTADVFVGYSDTENYLGQRDTANLSSNYLNSVGRNFAYVSNYDKDEIVTNKYSDSAVYYKPMLIFPDGGEDSYFVREAMKFIGQAGVDPKKVVALNEDPNNKGHINPAVGMRAYLHMSGLSDDDISNSLNKSGEMADYVVKKLGYPDSGPGTWRKFITDFRPEWLFSTEDIVQALSSGVPLTQSAPERFSEFYTVYPGEFSEAPSGGDGELDFDDFSEGAEEAEGSGDWGESEGGNNTGTQGTANDYYDIGDDGSGNEDGSVSDEALQEHYKQGLSDGARGVFNSLYVSGKPSELQQAYQMGYNDAKPQDKGGHAEYQYNSVGGQGYDLVDTLSEGTPAQGTAGTFGSTVGANGGRQSWDESSSEPITAKLPVVDTFGSQGEYVPDGAEVLSQFKSNLKNLDFSNPQSLISALEGLLGELQQVTQPRVPHQAGKSSFVGGFESNIVDVERPGAQEDVRDTITRGLYASIGGAGNLRSLAILDRDVIVNKQVYRPRFSRRMLEALPSDIRADAARGKVLGVINWRSLKDTAGTLISLAIDNEMVIREYLSSQLGWRGRVSVPTIFRQFPSLQVLMIGDERYTRKGYRKEVQGKENRVEEGAFLSVLDSFSNKRKESREKYFGKMRANYGKKKRWVVFNATMGTANWVGQQGSRLATGSARVGSSTLSRLRYALTDTQRNMGD